jgi:hypothetical protein
VDILVRLSSATRAVLAMLCVAFATGGSAAAADGYSEDAVKAAFLYRFAGYVEWPAETTADRSFTIAVLGADGVARELAHLLPGHSIKNRPAQVKTIRSVRELGDARILYVGPGHNSELSLTGIASRPVLVVTDNDGGLDQGSEINFLLLERRLRFEVSLSAADRAGLKISSELLSVAVRVQGSRLR